MVSTRSDILDRAIACYVLSVRPGTQGEQRTAERHLHRLLELTGITMEEVKEEYAAQCNSLYAYERKSRAVVPLTI